MGKHKKRDTHAEKSPSPQPTPRPPQSPAMSWSGLGARAIVGILLMASGLLKAAAPSEEFAVVIESYRFLPQDMIMSLAGILPWIELFVGCSLLVGYMTRAAAAVSSAMLATFILALSSVLIRGIPLPNCGCFGFGWHPSPGQTLGMDIVLLALAVLAFRRGSGSLSLDNWVAEGS